jgi:CRP-like cAMP-binding protein
VSHGDVRAHNQFPSEWDGLDEAGRELLEKSRTCAVRQPGDTVFRQGDPCLGLYWLDSGLSVLRKSDDQGRAAIVRIAHGRQVLGYRAFFERQSHAATAVALIETHVCFIESATAWELLNQHPAVSAGFLHRIAEDLRLAEETRLFAIYQPARARLAALLLELKDRLGQVDDEGVLTIQLPLSRTQLAELLGVRPETISRAMGALEADKVATFGGGVAKVPDLDGLLDELEAEPS